MASIEDRLKALEDEVFGVQSPGSPLASASSAVGDPGTPGVGDSPTISPDPGSSDPADAAIEAVEAPPRLLPDGRPAPTEG